MNEVERIADELDRSMTGDPWHGPSLVAVLDGVTARAAAARPISSAHTICELVLHLAGWTREVTRRLAGHGAGTPLGGDWPAMDSVTDATWAAANVALIDAHHELIAAVSGFPADRLEAVVGPQRDAATGTGTTYAVMLHGLTQHYAYHGGQIAMLRKAIGGREAH